MRQVLCPRVIGRDEELRAIAAALDAARGGHGETLFLLGEAGVGKSRLTREAERLAQARGLRVLRGRSVEAGSGAYRPIAEALLSALRRDGLPEPRPELRPFQHILARLIPDWREDGVPAVEESLVLLAEAVLRLLRAMSSTLHRGCLLVLEDLHWADAETISVLEYLTTNAAGEPLAILATSRTEPSSASLALARSLAAQRVGTVLELERLAPAAVREMASACLGDSPLPDALEGMLNASADGLPLLVEDLLAEWVGAGALVRGDDGWQLQHVAGTVVPLSFSETVRRRLRQLGDEPTHLLRLAALLGRRFEWTLLPAASGLDEDRVLELLHAAVDAQMLVAEPSGFGFRHALTRDAVLAELLPAERARQAARLLALVEADLEGERSELAAELAYIAGDRVKAARLLLGLGQTLLAKGALATAESALLRSQAMVLMSGQVDLQAAIEQVLLQVLSQAGKYERVLEVGDALLLAHTRTTAPALRWAEVHLTMATAAVAASDLQHATQHLEAARVQDHGGALEARLDALAAHVAIDERRTDDAERLAQAALVAAEEIGQTDVACEALIVIGRLARGADLDRAEAAFQRAHHLAEAHQLTVWHSRALHELGTIDMFRDASPERLLAARALAVDSGALETVAWVDGELSALYNTRFEMDRSLEAARSALEAGRRFRLRGVQAMALLFEAEVFAYRQDRPAMERALAELARVSQADPFFNIGTWESRAILSLLGEDRQRAGNELHHAVELARTLPVAAPSPTLGLWALIQTLDDEESERAREALRSSSAMVNLTNRGYLAYADAIDLGHHGQAAAAAAAVEIGDRHLAPAPWYRHYGLRLVAEAAIRDGWGQPSSWLRQAEVFFEQHGYQAVTSACRALLRKSGASVPRPGARRGVPEPFRGQGVTEREMEVLAILADGLSNKQIGSRLYLSAKTVEKHVASLMNKLEVRTRAQLATIAAVNMGDGVGRTWGRSSM